MLLQAWNTAAAQVQTSGMQRVVAETLQDMGLEPQLEHKTPDLVLSIDIALPQHKVAIEVSLYCC